MAEFTWLETALKSSQTEDISQAVDRLLDEVGSGHLTEDEPRWETVVELLANPFRDERLTTGFEAARRQLRAELTGRLYRRQAPRLATDLFVRPGTDPSWETRETAAGLAGPKRLSAT